MTDDQRQFVRRLADSVLPASSDAESEISNGTDLSYVYRMATAED